MLIEVWTYITYNCSEHAELLHKSLEYFKSGKHELRYRAIESIGCDYWPKQWKHVEKTSDYNNTSVTHAVAMHCALTYIQKSEEVKFVIFIDADMCVLMQDWDDIVIKNLCKFEAWGCGYPVCGYKNYHYQGFPSPHFFCFHTGVMDKVRFNFMPLPLEYEGNKNAVRIRFSSSKEASIYGKKEMDRIKCDTGWLTPKLFKDAKLKYSALDMLFSGDKLAKLPWKDKEQNRQAVNYWRTYMNEWLYNGKLFATHKKNTKRGTLQEDNIAKVWKQRVDLYTQKEFGMVL